MAKYYIEMQNDGTWTNNEVVGRFLKALGELSTGRHVITLERYKKQRSLSQNRFYHGIVVPCVYDGMVAMGFNSEDLSKEIVHEMLKAKFLTHDIANEAGEYVSIVKSTAELNTVDFMAYLEDIYRWSGEFLRITIPQSGEQAEFNI